MLKSDEARAIESRRAAQGLFAKVNKEKDPKTLNDTQIQQVAEAAKTVRLRALRLAKEAADKLAAETAAATVTVTVAPKRVRKAKAKTKVENESDVD